MAEHDEKNFEHEISERFKMLDSNIKIPEIPDAQSIFEKAEEKKSNVVPFKKYSRYIAAAAAVVLICIGVPVMGAILSGGIGMANMDEPERDSNNYFVFDSINQTDDAAEAVAECQPEPEEADTYLEPTSSDTSSSKVTDDSDGISYAAAESKIEKILYDFFAVSFEVEAGISSESSSSDFRIEENPLKENSVNGSITEKPVYGDDVSFIEEDINKKRSIEMTVEKDSVSVLLLDNSGEKETISAFWIEGTYLGSYLDGDYYVIDLEKSIDPEELSSGYYLPMVGDASGTYYISAEDIFVPETITKGAIALAVEINVGTGEYRIYASLV